MTDQKIKLYPEDDGSYKLKVTYNVTNPNEAAFAKPGDEISRGTFGLTKREYFAVMAMQASISTDPEGTYHPSKHAEYGVIAADALIAELNK